MIISIEDNCILLYWLSEKRVELTLDSDAIMNKDDIRLIVTFYKYDNKATASILCYEKTSARGWIRKEVRKEIDFQSLMIDDGDIKLGDVNMKIKRLAISDTHMPESVFMPYSNTNGIYDSAFIYVDADSYPHE